MSGAFIPLIATVVGNAVGGLAATAIGKAFIGIGLSLGASYLSDKASPKTRDGIRGQQLSTRYETNELREIIVGTHASEGSLKYQNVFGPNGNDYVEFVFVLADVPCDSLVGVVINGKAVTLGSEVSTAYASGRTVSEYPGVMWIKFHDGASDQEADADLVAHNTEWTEDHRGRGMCYVRVTLKYDEKLFPQGVPSFRFIFKGAKLYDWRKDTTVGGSGSHRWGDESTYEWTDNPVVIWYNYRRGIYVNGQRLAGMNTRPLQMPLTQWTSAANACDESVSLKAGGTEKRYRCNGWIVTGTDHDRVRNDILACIAGYEADCGGIVRIYPGVAQASVMTISDSDLIAEEQISYVPKLSITALSNYVVGNFVDPAMDYEPNSLPRRVSPEDIEADNDFELRSSFDLAYVTSGTQGQRILEILRRRGRYQRSITITLRARCCVLEAGDWITWSSDRYGFVSTKWEIMKASLQRDLAVVLELREVSESIFSWIPGTDELDPLDPKPVAAGNSSFTTIQNWAIAATLRENPLTGATRPGLHGTFDEITDPTVVGVLIQYRREGEDAAAALEYEAAVTPGLVSATWLNGVIGDVKYLARIRPVTRPDRSVTWTGWAETVGNTPATIVEVSLIANEVPPDTITEEMLSQQARFELGLVTATDEVLGSVYQQIEQALQEFRALAQATITSLALGNDNRAKVTVERTERISEDQALAQQITTAIAELEAVAAAVQQEITARVNADGAIAQLINSAVTRIDEQEFTVQVLAQSMNGVEGRIGLVMNSNNHVVGYATLDGNQLGSTFTVAANAFQVALLGTTGGGSVPVFGIATVNGVPRLALRADMFADGTITARNIAVSSLSAISTNFGSGTYSGVLQSAAGANGNLLLNFNNPEITLTTGP